jgi:hypothetical protein
LADHTTAAINRLLWDANRSVYVDARCHGAKPPRQPAGHAWPSLAMWRQNAGGILGAILDAWC